MINKSAVNVYTLDAEQIIKRELPNLDWFYNKGGDLHADVHWLFGEFIDNRKNLPIVEISEAAGDRLVADSTRHYQMMLAGLDKFFKETDNTINKYMESTITKHRAFGNFLNYARDTWRTKDKTIYGRYDIAIDGNGNIKGMYEFNGDTPVMLFESVNLQNLISNDIYEPEAQLNNWWNDTLEEHSNLKGKTVAVVCELGAIEDLSNCETVMQAFDAVGAKAYMCGPQDLNHDLLYLEKPFEITNVHERPDVVFILLPWEEMLTSGDDILANWKSWSHNVKFLEPAWRWFMSNKGFFAYLTHLLENDDAFAAEWRGVKHIPTYLDSNGMSEYVMKPKLGRLGQNISVIRDGNATNTGGAYDDEKCIYQPIVQTTAFGNQSLLATAWIAGNRASTIAFRVFGGDVTNYNDEQWMAHRVVF